MKPYYDRDGITIYCGDCRDVVPSLSLASVDIVLTDPPYSSEVHQGARSLRLGETPLVDFEEVTADYLRDVVASLAPIANRWYVATMAWQHVYEFAANPPEGWRFVRFGVWVKPNGAPQFTGDRPGPGWEALCFLHKADRKLSWEGGGRSSVFTVPKVETEHPTGKPIKLIRQLVELFAAPKGLVLDPFMGSGTTLRAALDCGRRAIGIELEERYCEIAVKRLRQSVLALDIRA